MSRVKNRNVLISHTLLPGTLGLPFPQHRRGTSLSSRLCVIEYSPQNITSGLEIQQESVNALSKELSLKENQERSDLRSTYGLVGIES